jgi:hypothetical protein
MKTKLTALVLGALTCLLAATDAKAQFITGNIGFAGSVALDTESLATATAVNNWRTSEGIDGALDVVVMSGDFGVLPLGTNATLAQPFIFNPSTPYMPLWTAGGFVFDLNASMITMQTAMSLRVEGTGFISADGFQDTPATWSFTLTNDNGQNQARFAVATDTSALAVPEGGSAVALLGLALAGMGAIRHKIRSK